MEVSLLEPIFAGIGFVAGWCVKQWYVKVEIDKLRAEKAKLEEETLKYAGENLEKLQRKRAAYNDLCESCKQVALRLINELKSDSQVIAETREELCTAVHNKAIPTYIELIEFEQLTRKDDPEQLKVLIADDVVAELRRIGGWIDIINSPTFIMAMKLAPAKIDKRTLSPFGQLLKVLPSKDQNGVEANMLKKAINSIIESGL
jgi:hypothetical protein